MDNKLLQNSLIPQDLWCNCYVSESGKIFSPRIDNEGNIIATGYEIYEEWKKQKNMPIIPPTQTPQQQRISDLETALFLQQQVTDNLIVSALEV